MKAHLAHTAIAASLLSLYAGAQAQDTVTVYGLIDAAVSLSRASGGTSADSSGTSLASTSARRLDSGVGPGGTRLGFRGQEDLGDGLSAMFTLEMGYGIDTGTLQQGGLAWGRQAFIGLSDKSGWSLSLGRQYTPMNLALSYSDPSYGFYWGNPTTNTGFAVYDSIGAAPGSGFYGAPGRQDNSVLFSLSQSALTGRLMIGFGNENTRGAGRMLNPGVAYASGPLTLNASMAIYRQNAEAIGPSAKPEWLRDFVLGGSYKFDAFTLFAGYYGFNGPKNRANNSSVATPGDPTASPFAFNWDRTRAYWLGGRIPMANGTAVLSATRSRYEFAAGDDGKTVALCLAYEYPLSKRTLLYGSHGQVANNRRVRSPLLATVNAVLANGYGSDLRATSVGMRHTF